MSDADRIRELEAKLTNALECREGYLKELERMSVVAYEREAKLAAAEAARDFTYDQSVQREVGWSMEKSLFKQQRDAAVAGEKRWQEASNTDRALLQAQVRKLRDALRALEDRLAKELGKYGQTEHWRERTVARIALAEWEAQRK